MQIVILDASYLQPQDKQALEKFGTLTTFGTNPPPDPQTLINRLKDAEIVVNLWSFLTDEIISALPKLRCIVTATVGVDKIDLDAAKKHHVTVVNCPGYNAQAVAEHTIGLILAAARLTAQSEQDIRKNLWQPDAYKGKELQNKTLGIIGYGDIGKKVAEIANKGFSMKVIYTDRNSSREDLELLLQSSDVISVNAPLNNQTRNLLSDQEFSLMKPGIILVNTGRGAIIDEKALVENLKSGKVFAAGLDVLSIEPMQNTDPLFSLPNVIITPHIAWNSQESEAMLSKMVVENVQAFVAGRPANIVNA
ncbi:hypothetical protein C4579_00425 [Candidatus Microgenomates bacterium]|nr:MAG: hypothetical protein C4579_00425 [Candidatus Microgenomates bacterium]